MQVTLASVLEQIGQPDLPVEKTWRLNERWMTCFFLKHIPRLTVLKYFN
jgi:hypothetical protein